MQLPHPTNSRVVLIASGSYNYTYTELPAVHNNVFALKKNLSDNEICGISEECISVVNDPENLDSVLNPIQSAAKQATDTLIIYFAGHGRVDGPRSDLQLVVENSHPDRPHTAVSYDQVRDYVLGSRAPRRIVILDCCFSGRALGMMSDPSDAIVGQAATEGTFVFTSVSKNKTAMSVPGERYSAFSGALIDLLERGDRNAPRHWDLNTMFRFMSSSLTSRGLPEPHILDRDSMGTLYFARNRAKINEPPSTRSESDGHPRYESSRTAIPPANSRPARFVDRGMTSKEVGNVQFSPSKLGRRGYSEDEVDDFLEIVESKIRDDRSSSLSSLDVRGMTFGMPPFGRRGYNMEEVDEFLERVVQDLQTRERGEITGPHGEIFYFENGRWYTFD